jgi:phosphohistidine phosphatase
LQELNNDVDSVVLFGHNPGFTEIPDELCSEGCAVMPKTGIIGITFDIATWKDLRRHSGKTVYFLKPENVL